MPLSFALPDRTRTRAPAIPEGNFGGNQLLDGSISLSPPIPKSDERFARQYRCGPPPEFPLLRPAPGIVHHLRVPTGMLTLEPFSEDQGRSAVHPTRGIPPISFLAPCGVYSPVDSHTCQTPWSVFQDGPNGVPAGRCREHAGAEARRDGACCNHDRRDGISTGISTARALAPHQSAPVPRPESIGGPALAALDGIYRPIGAAFPNNPTRRQRLVVRQGPGTTGSHPLRRPLPGDWARSAAEDASPDYNSDGEAVRFSSWAVPGSLAVTKGILSASLASARLDTKALTTTTSRARRQRGLLFRPTAPWARETSLRPKRHASPLGRRGRGRRDA
ncbi:hypothetical protein L6452_45606 [Arctium lappa]|nr:hypothetical protein L6452_45606 [Arctium lappa]